MKKFETQTGATLCSSMRPRSATTLWLKFKLLAFAFMALLSINQVWGADTWTKLTSVPEVGDVVILVNETAKREMTGISTSSTKYGLATTYSTSPAGTYPLTVCAGNSTGSLAFKTSDNKYLYWTSGNSLNVNETLDNKTSWTATVSSGNFTITNVATNTRVIKYNKNSGSERFACYTSGQETIQLYKKASSKKTVNYTLANVTGDGSNPTETDGSQDLTLGFTAADGYNLPNNITVTIGGATKTAGTDYEWEIDGNYGMLGIDRSKITGNISVTITAEQAANVPVYLDLNNFTNWENDGAGFRVYAANANHNFTKVNDDPCNSHLYVAEVPASALNTTLYFKRGPGDHSYDYDNQASGTFTTTNNTMFISDWSAGTIGPRVIKYDVTFNMNGHGHAISGQNCVTKATAPSNPSVIGYTFGGWYTTSTCTGSQYDFNTTLTADVELFAKWTATGTKTIYLNPLFTAEGSQDWRTGEAVIFAHAYIGLGNSEYEEVYDAKMTAVNACDAELTCVIPTNTEKIIFVRDANGTQTIDWTPSSEGGKKWNETASVNYSSTYDKYQITGWNAASTASSNFTAAKYTITFNGNGASGSMTTINNLACGANQTIPACTFTAPTDKAFDGWKANVNVTINNATVTAGTKISAGATLQNITSDITLTAQWRDLPKYTVTLKDDNTELTQEHYQSSVTLPSRTTSCAGYTFEGWSTTHVTTETSTKPTIITAGSYTPTTDIELWPVFSKTTGGGTKTDVINASLTSGYLSDVASSAWYGNSMDSYFAVTGSETGNEYIMNSMGLKDDTYGYALRWNKNGWLQCSESAHNDVLTSITITGANKSYSVYASVEGESFYLFDDNLVVTNGTGTFTLTGDTTRYLEIDGMEASSTITSITLTYGSSSTTYIAEPECYETTITLAKGTDGKTDGTATAAKGSSTLSGYTAAVGPDHYHLLGYYDGDTKVIDASGHLVANAGSYTDGSANWQKLNAAVTLTAKWEINSHSLTWDLDGGTAGTGTITPAGPVAYGTVLQYTVEPTKAGKKFNGWSPEMISGTTTMPDNDQTYTAQWRDIVWTDYLTDCSAPYTWTIWYEDPSDNVWKDAAITDGQAQFTLAKESTFNFKLRKTNVDDPRDPEDYTYYGPQNTENSYTTSGTQWTLDYINGEIGHDVHVHAGAAGTYTINVTNMTGDAPQISVTYPTAYTITYAGGDGASGEMSPTINIAAGEDVVLPDPTTFTKTDWNCIGWTANVNVTVNSATVTAGSFIPKTATIQNINSDITLTAVWEQLVITQADELYEVVVGGTLQLTLTASYSPNITTGALYTWATNNINYATVSNTGLVTGHQAVNSGEYVTVTSSYGTVSNGYDIVVKSAACDTWGLHYWNTENHTSGDLCFENVGGDEWRTDQEHLFTLPSNSDADKLKLLYGGHDSDHAEEWAFRKVPTIASQAGNCGESDGNHYSGQDAIGYFRIFANSGDKNSYLGFQPVYSAAFGRDGENWQIKDFANTGNAGYHGHEYATDINDMIEVPEGYDTDVKLYVGTKNSHGTVNQVYERSNMRLMSNVPELNGAGHAHEFGRLYIHPADACNNADNYDVHFVRFYRLHYDLDGGETAAAYDDQFAWSLAEKGDRTFALAATPTRDGYTFLGWSVNSTTMQPGASVTLSDDVTATAIWAENFTVTYEIGGYSSSCSSETTHYCGEENIIVCDNLVVPTGYTFNGWTSNITIGGKTSFKGGNKFTMPCSNVVFTADVTADEYDITYNGLEGASNTNPKKYTIESAFDFVAPGERAGYTFVGWFDAETDGNPVTGITLGSMGIVTVWAHWTANSYSVTLDKNEGDADGTATFVYNTSAPTSYVAATRNGYDLAGYYATQAAGGQIVLNADGSVADGSLNNWKTDGKWTRANNDGVLYAKWTAKSNISYTVNHYQMDPDGETYTLKEHSGGTGSTGQDKSSSAQPKTYEGFATPEAQTLILTWPGPCVVDYYYERNKYELTWEGLEDATVTGEYTQGQVYHGATITYPTSVSKDGYYFKGWDITPAKMPIGATTITAQWAAYENYRTYCGNAVTFYAQNGSDPEEEFVITTDNGKITTPTLSQTGFTQPEGWVLIGWTKVGDDTHAIVELGKTNVVVADGDEYNAVWTHITITGNVLTTSAVGVQVGTTIHVEGTTNTAYGLRVSFVDTKGTDDPSDDVTYGSATGQTAVAQSDFRLANTSYIYIDGSIIQIGGDTHNQDYNVVYTPRTANEIDNYVLQIQVMQSPVKALDGAVYTLNLKGRALPDNFVIAEYLNDKWYALPADMNGSGTYEGKEITVEGEGMNRVVTNATLDRVYSMKTYNHDKSHVLFQSQFNQGHLWAATGTETGINDNAKTISGRNDAYSWMPTPQGATLDTYVMSNVNNTKTLVLNSDFKFGMYTKYNTNTETVYFIPLKAEEYVEKDMMMVEWFPTKVLVEVEDALTDVRAKVNNVEVADVTASDTKYGTHLYEITGLNTLVDNAAKELTILYTKEETTYGHKFDIPVIVSNKTYILSSSKAENKFPWTQAVYNTADLVVRDNSVLTVDGATDAANTFGNVTIYPTSKVIVPAQTAGDNATDITMTTTTMTLFGGTDEIYDGSEYTLTKYGVPQLVLNGKLVHNETTSGLVYDVRLDATQYYNFALPYTSKYELVTDNKGGEDFTFWTKVYDGATRAAGNNGWVWYNWNADPWAINIGTGYMFAAQPYSGQNYIIIRHPMGYSTTGDTYAQNEGGHQSGTAEATKAAVDVYAYPSKYDNNAGWNYIANPFMANFTKDLGDGCTGTIQTGQLVKHKVNEKWDGHYEWKAGSLSVRYVTLYDNGSDTYEQLPMSTAVLAPFTGFFVQMAEGGQIVFDISGRTNSAPARMLSEDELPSEMEIFLHATCQGQKDDAVLFINDNLHRDNAKEFPNEMTKQENANTLNFYTFGGDDVKMYANGMSYEDAQGWSKAGVKVATAGEYTFSVASDQADYIQQVILRDMDSNTEYDLMSNDAKIYLDKGEMNDRFYVKIVFGKHNIGTDVTERYDTSGPEKFILNDHMYIRANGVLYDGVGKRVKY